MFIVVLLSLDLHIVNSVDTKMWIINFTNLIAKEESQRVSLKNCSVVIDAQNYLYKTYEDSNMPYVFGCEANEYAKYLKNRLNMFKKAGVKCYIVLKGGDTDIEKKIAKIKALNFDFDSNYQYVQPIFVKDVWVQVSDEMRLNYAVCVAESKDECVALARQLRCPVMSNDIEFCFRNALYIPYSTMRYNNQTKSIDCRQYNREDFLQKYRLTKEKFAIFATLSDLLVFPQNFFNTLLQTWGVLNKYNKQQHTRLIQWLSNHSEYEAKRGIMKTLTNDDDKNKFINYYNNLLKTMQTDKSGRLTNYLITSKLTVDRQDPNWFEKGVASCNIPSVYINLYKWNIIEGSWVIEDKQSSDSLLLSIDIIKYVYNLLKNYKSAQIKLYTNGDNCTEIDTDDTNIKKPSYQCKESVFENGWSQLKRLKLFEHFLSENKINIEVLSKVPVEATVLFAALVYFARKKGLENMDVKKEVYAVLLSYVIINVVFDEKGSYNKLNNNITDEDCIEATRATKKYFIYSKDEAKRIYDGVAIKRLVELQFCWRHLNNLNILCGSPYKSSKYSRMFNGTFVYNVFWAMQEKNCDVFMNELLHSAPSVLAFVKKMLKTYEDLKKKVY